MSEGSSAYEKMLAGESYLSPDPDLGEMIRIGQERLAAFNAVAPGNMEGYARTAKALFGRIDMPTLVQRPFTCEYGIHIEISAQSFVNMGCTFLDNAPIRIGAHVALGPNCQLITATHPLPARQRHIDWPDDAVLPFRAAGHALPITLEDDVWLGAGVIVLPGVTIGARTVVGAGSVVTKSLPPDVLAFGNPCRIVRKIEN